MVVVMVVMAGTYVIHLSMRRIKVVVERETETEAGLLATLHIAVMDETVQCLLHMDRIAADDKVSTLRRCPVLKTRDTLLVCGFCSFV